MTSLSPAEKFLSGALLRVERLLRTQLRSLDPQVGRVLAWAAAGRGKRLRARLVLLAARAAGLRGARDERLAAVFEMLHLASLVHDDVIDGSGRRRHRATLNARFGNSAAVLAGDLILVRAVRLLEAGRYPTEVRHCVVRAAAAVCLGELQELQHKRDLGMVPARYLAMVRNKTASLMSAACEAGARLSGADGRRSGALARFGLEFGIAFQVRDDLLDLTGDPARLGKPVGQDHGAGHVTLPVILGLRLDRRRVTAGLRSAGRGRAGLRRALAATGALDLAERRVRDHAARACSVLRVLPDSPARRALAGLAEQVAVRED